MEQITLLVSTLHGTYQVPSAGLGQLPSRCPACPGLGAPQRCLVTPLWLLGVVCGLWSGQKLWFRLSRARLWSPLCCSLYRAWFVPRHLPKPHPKLGGCAPFKGGVLGVSEPRPGARGVAECTDPCSSPPGGPQLPWSRGGWLSGTAGCVLTSLAPCALEPQHGSGSGLVPGPAAAPAGEGGGDPLGQQVPPAAPASWEARQVRGGPEEGRRVVLLGAGRGWAGVGVGCARHSIRVQRDAHGRMDERTKDPFVPG